MMETCWGESLKALIERSRSFEPRILGVRSQNALKQLNNELPVPDANYLHRDYRGVAYYLGFKDKTFIETLENSSDPMEVLLKNWEESSCHCVANLLESLYSLERFDVLEDIHSLIEEDINYECSRRPPIQSNQVSSSERSSLMYHAFVCYAEEDLRFVKKLMHVLEKENSCNLFLPERDLNIGVSKDTVTAEVIEKHCHRMIVILSRSFLRSPACDFQVKFAHCLAPGSHSKRMIPVLIDKGFDKNDIPPVLKHVTLCDYTKSDTQEWFWSRLVRSVKESTDFSHGRSLPSSEVTRMDCKRSSEQTSVFNKSNEVSSSLLPSLPHFRSSPSSDSGLVSMETTSSGAESGINSGLFSSSSMSELNQPSHQSLQDRRYQSAPVTVAKPSVVHGHCTAPVPKKSSFFSRIFTKKKRETEMMDTSF